MNYGIPYMGSKSKICEKVCRLFPKADNFYDLFGGGFSISHFMIKHRSKDFKTFHYNEIRKGMGQLIKDAMDGKYNYKNYTPEWISREDFFKRKESEPFVKMIWSFGNNGEGYLFGKDIEEQKRSMHFAVCFNEFNTYAKEIFGIDKFKEGYSITDKRLYLKNRLRVLKDKRIDFEQLERLEQLQQLQQLERLEQLHFHEGSYQDVKIEKNSVVYCDIPYQGTAEYSKTSLFNYKQFFDWAASQVEPVFISEYNVSDTRFKCIASFKKKSLLAGQRETLLEKIERVYVNEAGYKITVGDRNVLSNIRNKEKEA